MHMSYRLILLFLFVLASYFAPGQKKGLVNSGLLIEQGIKLHAAKKYKEAIAMYKQVSRSDTNYKKVLHELAYSSYLDSNFDASRKYAEEGLRRFPHEATNWYNLLANAHD